MRSDSMICWNYGSWTALQNLQGLGISVDLSVSAIASKLKELVATEWLGENSDEYQEFLTHSQLHEQAALLQQLSANLPSDIMDLVILAVSHQLQLPVVLFTSLKNLPITIQLPTHSVMSHSDPVLIAYTPQGHRKQYGCFRNHGRSFFSEC